MIPNLNHDYFARPKFVKQRLFEIACFFLDLRKGPEHVSPRIEDCGPLFEMGERGPSVDEAVATGRFHPLRAGMSAPKFATRFQT